MSSRTLPNLFNWAGESLFVADMILIGLAVFFVVLGAFDPLSTLATPVVLATTAGLVVARRRWQHRHPEQHVASLSRARERRGF